MTESPFTEQDEGVVSAELVEEAESQDLDDDLDPAEAVRRIRIPTMACEVIFYVAVAWMFLAKSANVRTGGSEVLILIAALVAVPGLRAARKLKGYTLANIGLIFALLSCVITAIGILAIPFAVWGLIVLANPTVKQSFES